MTIIRDWKDCIDNLGSFVIGFSPTEDVLEKSSKLIEKAHAILSQSHKTSIDIPDSEREKIKVLRRNLNSGKWI